MKNALKALSAILLVTVISQSQAMFTRNLGNLSRFCAQRLSPIQGRFSTPSNTWFSKPWVRRAALFGAPTVAAATTAYVGASIGNDMLQESRCETRLAQHKLDEMQKPFHRLPTSNYPRTIIHFKAKGTAQPIVMPVTRSSGTEAPQKNDMANFQAFGRTYAKCINAQVYGGEFDELYNRKLTGPCLTVSSILNNNIAQKVADGKLKDKSWYYPFLEDARQRIGNPAPLARFFDPEKYHIHDLKIDVDEKRSFDISGKIRPYYDLWDIPTEALILRKYNKEFSQCMKNPKDKDNWTCRALKTPDIKAAMPGVTFDEFGVDVTFDEDENE
jgi:hypothetical protein